MKYERFYTSSSLFSEVYWTPTEKNFYSLQWILRRTCFNFIVWIVLYLKVTKLSLHLLFEFMSTFVWKYKQEKRYFLIVFLSFFFFLFCSNSCPTQKKTVNTAHPAVFHLSLIIIHIQDLLCDPRWRFPAMFSKYFH